uniref:site-specific DNA-methyltransferase n=1 Tax=Flavobacterium sp. TaxID=239 RepID=UPI00404A6387
MQKKNIDISNTIFTSWSKHVPNKSLCDNFEFDKNENFVFKGDNLPILKSLETKFYQKIKLIYIDPPYNTGNKKFQYDDNFVSEDWLKFIEERLLIAWDLLSNDGAIFIQVDDNEFAYLKVLCDRIFGRKHCKETIVIKSSTESGVNAVNVKRGERLFKVKEYILFYTKSESFRFKPFYTKSNYNYNYKYLIEDASNASKPIDLLQRFYREALETNNSEIARIIAQKQLEKFALSNPEKIYSLEKNIKKAGEKFKTFASQNKEAQIIECFINSKKKPILMFDGGTLVPLKDRIVSHQGKNHFGVLASDLWVDIGTTPAKEGNVKFTNGKKPERLLARIIEMCTIENDYVLDFFAGSGTTAATALKMNRNFITIEKSDYQENDCLQRLQYVLDGEQSGISKQYNWKGGKSFISAKIKSHNSNIIKHLSIIKSKKDLEILIFEINNYSPENHFSLITEEIPFDVLKEALINWLDENPIYGTLSDLAYEWIQNSPHEIEMSNKFYLF